MNRSRATKLFYRTIFGAVAVFPLLLSALLIGRKAILNFPTIIGYVLIVAIIFAGFGALVYFSPNIESKLTAKMRPWLVNLLSITFIILIGTAWRIYLILKFPSPAASDSLLALTAAQKWVSGPGLAPQEFFSQHWGIYAVTLSKLFIVFGSSLNAAKGLAIFAAAVTVASVYYICLKSFKNYGLALSAGLMLALWPSYALYANFLSGEHLFIMFFALSTLALVIAKEKLDENKLAKYFLFILVFSIFISLGNIYKELGVITLPAAVLVFGFMIVGEKLSNIEKLKMFTFSILILFFCSFAIGHLSDATVSHYAKGPVDHYKTGYFIATGLSFETGGRYNTQIAASFLDPLKAAVAKNQINDTVYKNTDATIMNKTIENTKSNLSKLPKLFLTKFYTVWAGEDEINNWNYDDYTLTNSRPSNETLAQLKNDLKGFNLFSNAYLLFVIALAFLGALALAIEKKGEAESALLFSALIVIGFSAALLLIEVLTRYRSILYPSLVILAAVGLGYVARKLGTLSYN